MRFDVFPLQGVNDIKFGMSRSMVRDMLGLPDSAMKRNEADAAPFDHYHEYGLFCYYDADDTP